MIIYLDLSVIFAFVILTRDFYLSYTTQVMYYPLKIKVISGLLISFLCLSDKNKIDQFDPREEKKNLISCNFGL